jgi:hypothetical protein
MYTLVGTSQDIETIIRLRPWMEDEVKSQYGEFRGSKLITDYDAGKNIFEFKILFYR